MIQSEANQSGAKKGYSVTSPDPSPGFSLQGEFSADGGVAESNPGQHGPASALVVYSLVALLSFAAAMGTSFTFLYWDQLTALIYESHLARYEVMSGERGPATYLVFHKNFEHLQQLAESSDEILGVEHSDFSNVAKMAFRSAKSPLIEAIRSDPLVMQMVNRNVPMICH